MSDYRNDFSPFSWGFFLCMSGRTAWRFKWLILVAVVAGKSAGSEAPKSPVPIQSHEVEWRSDYQTLSSIINESIDDAQVVDTGTNKSMTDGCIEYFKRHSLEAPYYLEPKFAFGSEEARVVDKNTYLKAEVTWGARNTYTMHCLANYDSQIVAVYAESNDGWTSLMVGPNKNAIYKLKNGTVISKIIL